MLARRALLSVLLIIAFAGVCTARPPQRQSPETDPETARGITLFQQSQAEAAITVLREVLSRNQNDLRAWHYLGLALEKTGDLNESRKAHEKAALLGDRLINDQVEAISGVIRLNELFRSFGVHLTEAAESADKYLALEPKLSRKKREEWNSRSESLRSFADVAQAGTDTDAIFKTNEVDVRPRILSKLEPHYTEEARQHGTTGMVVLSVILGANGKVFGIQPIKTLPHGLTGEAFKAARRIKFVPAVKDGKPVSVAVHIEYGFYLY
jgi:TonB family protein